MFEPEFDFETWGELFKEHARSIGYEGPVDIFTFREIWKEDEISAENAAEAFVAEMNENGKIRVCSRVCRACPFRATSAPGWLGPHSVQEILNTMQFDQLFSCHLTRDDETTEADILSGRVPICRGFIASANASFKLFGQNPEFGPMLRALQDQVKAEGLEDMGEILNRNQFANHHK